MCGYEIDFVQDWWLLENLVLPTIGAFACCWLVACAGWLWSTLRARR